jgi:pyruvate-formate lyase-activating enzyme
MTSPIAKPDASATAYLVWPTTAGFRTPGEHRGAAAEFLERLRTLARCRCDLELRLLLVDSQRRLFWLPDTRLPVAPAGLASDKPVVLLVNAAVLLQEQPPLAALAGAAKQGRVVVCAARDGDDLGALACPRQALTASGFVPLVCRLASCLEHHGEEAWLRKGGVKRLDAGRASRKHSPAGAALAHPRRRQGPFAPAALNTALAELLDHPVDDRPVARSPQAMRAALLAQRERSAVPWVFNALINYIEYRIGEPTLASFPPEVHLSLTGACNIECGFCSYAHHKAYFEYADLARVQRLDFLRHVHTLRLSSGLGEPTLNPNLAAIVGTLGQRYPHLVLNFFTNGLALHRKGLIEALIHNVTWINVSLNNADRQSFQEMCGKDLFDRLCSNLRLLHQAKLAANTLFPVVHGSMVLTTKSIADLPRMPALCRELGVDRFTAFPFASLQTDCRYGPAETLDKCRDQYDALYAQTIAEAAKHQVSIEIPPPSDHMRLRFGLEVRPLWDHAGIEEHPHPAAALVDDLAYEELPRPNCPQIWQTASIGARFRVHAGTASHFLYPCLGPLCTVDYSQELAFDFPGAAGFLALWNHPIFIKLRTAQRVAGLSPVCDICRGCDTRHPESFGKLNTLLAALRPRPQLIPAPQLIGRISR